MILEVNGLVLQHRSHLNASALIKALPEAGVTFVLLRRSADPTLHLGSRPVSQFPTGLEENPIERYTRYRGLRQVGNNFFSSNILADRSALANPVHVYVGQLYFYLEDVWIRTQTAAAATRRYKINHPSLMLVFRIVLIKLHFSQRKFFHFWSSKTWIRNRIRIPERPGSGFSEYGSTVLN